MLQRRAGVNQRGAAGISPLGGAGRGPVRVSDMKQIGVAIIGSGAIAIANHLPGLRLSRTAKLVALCDTSAENLARAQGETGVQRTYTDYREAIADPRVDAVIVAAPNFVHREIVLTAVAQKKHVLCEKPLALNYADAVGMYEAARAAGVRHMTAFTYRFVPAMRWMKHLVDTGAAGEIYHFRAQRFQDWGTRPLGWRQVKKLAGTGEMGDMLSHRIDYGHHLVGPFARLVADMKRIHPQRGGQPSDVDDWVAILGEFQSRATAVLESTKLATGRGEGFHGQDVVEINGSEASIVYSTQRPLELWMGKQEAPDLEKHAVPKEFLVWPGSPRDPAEGNPLVTFRYDQSVEFIQAIVEQRECRPSFKEGVEAQRVMDAALLSVAERRWVEVGEVR
jgi:predicted dehydrogenase